MFLGKKKSKSFIHIISHIYLEKGNLTISSYICLFSDQNKD